MPIDVDRKFVFIHVPKTGGTSIEAMFDLGVASNFFSRLPIATLVPPNKNPQHFTYRELCQNLSSDFLRESYKFAFVRNPWDRFLSEYCWRKQMYSQQSTKYAQMYYDQAHLESLESFIAVLDFQQNERIDAVKGFDGHLETQLSYVVDETGKIAMDFLGRFERFETDVRTIASSIGQPVEKLSHLLKSNRNRDYQKYYSSRSRSAVASFYEEDIDTFGYLF